jgi:hypothetical protein
MLVEVEHVFPQSNPLCPCSIKAATQLKMKETANRGGLIYGSAGLLHVEQ